MFRSACLIVVTLGTPLLAGDWNQFYGPTGDGHYTGPKIPTEWGPDKNVAWKVKVPGKGWSSPVIAKGKIYLTTAVPDMAGNQSLRTMCLDAGTGKVVWDKEIFRQEKAKAPNIHGKNSHASPTPVVDGNTVYVHFGHMGTAALGLTGKLLWTRTGLYEKPVHGNGGSPVLVDGILIFSCDGADKQFVVGLNARDGTTSWETPRNTPKTNYFSFGTPAVIDAGGGQKQVISQGSDVLGCYDAKTGKEAWRFKFKGYSCIPKPIAGHGLVYFATGYDSSIMKAVKPGSTPEEAWTLPKIAPHTPSPLLVGDELYMVSDKGIMSCVEAKTGAVVWEERIKGNYSSSPLFADGKIHFVSEEGKGTVIAAGRKFNQVGECDLKEKTQASFAAADGALYLRTEGHLYKFAAK